MRHSGLWVLALAAGCVTSDAGLSEAEQAEWDGSDWDPEGETVVIEGGFDACWDAGLCWPGVEPEPAEPTDPIGPTGGGGGGPGPGGGPKPARRDCKAEKDEFGEAVCKACCAWNHDNVDAPACAEIIFSVLKAACYQAAIATEVACGTMCREPDEGILTSGGSP